MYQITLTIRNPQTGASKEITRQIDPSPAVFTQAKWNAAFPVVRATIDELVTESTPNEPVVW